MYTYGSKHCLRRYLYNPLEIIPLQSYFLRRYLAGSIGNNHPLAMKDFFKHVLTNHEQTYQTHKELA